MKRLMTLLGMLALVLVVTTIVALPALAQMGPSGIECNDWYIAWFRTGSGAWYWQWVQWCWSPDFGWWQNFDGWGWE